MNKKKSFKVPLTLRNKIKCQQCSAIISRSDVDVEVALDIERSAEVDVSLQLAEVDELQGPSLPGSFQGLLESHAMCSARSRRHNTCQDLARREPKSEKVSINSKTF